MREPFCNRFLARDAGARVRDCPDEADRPSRANRASSPAHTAPISGASRPDEVHSDTARSAFGGGATEVDRRWGRRLDPDRAPKDVGRRIAELRRERGWTQEHLAERLGLQANNLQRIELGMQNLTVRSLVRLANGTPMAESSPRSAALPFPPTWRPSTSEPNAGSSGVRRAAFRPRLTTRAG